MNLEPGTWNLEPQAMQIRLLKSKLHRINKGDKVIIMAYADIEKDRVSEHKPKIVLVDDKNRVRKIKPD